MADRLIIVDNQSNRKRLAAAATIVAAKETNALTLSESSVIELDSEFYEEHIVVGSASMGGVSLTGAIFGSGTPVGGKKITLIGNSNTSKVSLVGNNPAQSKELLLKTSVSLGLGETITLMYNESLDVFVELGRSA